MSTPKTRGKKNIFVYLELYLVFCYKNKGTKKKKKK